jgi:undecaprenyl-diphosphatase
LSILQSIILGIIQGLTEFFPVSSSGHLVIVPYLLKWDYIPLYYTITVHFATLVAIVTIFHREIFKIIKALILAVFLKSKRNDSSFKLGIFIIVASIPGALAGFFLKKYVESFFSRPLAVAIFLLVTAAVLAAGEIRGRKIEAGAKEQKINFNLFISMIVGIGQALAIFPGISRSGATISFARFFGIKRSESVRFSFLLSIPIILGSFVFELFESHNIFFSSDFTVISNLAVGFVFSYVSGLFAIKFLMRLVKRRSLNVFSLYCTAAAAVIFIFYFFEKI